MLRIRLMGGFEVEGLEPARVGSRKARTLLKVLALARGAPVPVDRLADALWPDGPPARAADQVGVLVSRLRGVLGAGRLPRSDAGYALRADWIDVAELDTRAEEAAARLQAGSNAAARAAAAAALELARGPLLPDEDAPWADAERAAVDRALARVRLVSAEAALGAGDPAGAAAAAEAALDHDPYDEIALRFLMRAHAGAGRPASALAAYARVRERLAEDLGASPTPETEAVHRSVLLGEPAPAAPVAGRPPVVAGGRPFVGRSGELAVLDGLLAEAAAGRVASALVEGEAGIGKTAFAACFAARAAAAGSLVLSGRADELGRDLPLQPLLDGLEAHLRAVGPEAAAVVLGPDAAVIGPLLGGPQPATPGATLLPDAGAAQAALFASLLAVIERLARSAPVVVVVDDLHLAGPSTVEWLRLAGRRGRRLLVLATRRPEPGPSLPEAVPVPLGPLGAAEAAELVGSERAAELHARSRGHPLFLVELAASGTEELPASITEAVMARVADLGPGAATIVAAAVLGPGVDLDVLAEVLSRPAAGLLDDLEAAARARLLGERGAAFAFPHTLVREALAAGATASRRAWLHREAARVLSARPRPDPLEVAWHARLGGDADRAAAALVSAAALAEARYDLAEAERLLTEALGLAETAGARLARARVRLGRLDFVRADEDGRRALELGAGPEAVELTGWVAYYRRDWAAALRYADEAIRRAGDPGLRASCLALAGRIHHSTGRLAVADEHLSEALATAPPAVRGVAQVWMGGLRAHQGRLAEALDLAERALLEPERLGHPFARFHALFARVFALGLAGDVPAAFAAAEAFTAAVERAAGQAERFRPVAGNITGWLLRSVGEAAAATDANRAAVEAATNLSFAEPLHQGLFDLTELALWAGDLDAGGALLDRAAPGMATEGTMLWHQRDRFALLSARLALAAGDFETAATGAAAVSQEAAARGSRRHELFARVLGARVALAAGEAVDLDGVEAVLAELDGLAGLEVWWLTAEVAAASRSDRLWRAAEQRAGALAARAGPYRDQVTAHVTRRLGALQRRR